MRSLQFAGKPIKVSPNRLYNCSYLPVDDIEAFNEIMFLLLSDSIQICFGLINILQFFTNLIAFKLHLNLFDILIQILYLKVN